MFPVAIFLLLLSSVKAQYDYQQQQYPYDAYNQNLFNAQNYPSWNQGAQQSLPRVRGTLLSNDTTALPSGSQIIVSLADVSLQDVASRPLNTLVLYGSYRFPIPFEIPYSMAQVQTVGNTVRQYVIQARIEKDGQLLYINDQYTPVRLIPAPINSINVSMTTVAVTTSSRPTVFTTKAPTVNIRLTCQLIPEVGPCRATIPQYYFNTQSRSCQLFTWGGCGGNQNRFNSREECERTCFFNGQAVASNQIKQE